MATEELTSRRETMVTRQLARRGIRDERLLGAMRAVPRERFVAADMAEFAYDDSPLPIGERQTISQPYVVALMTQALEVAPGDRVLEIGTGSGYAAAVLAELAREVYTVERHRSLADVAAERLRSLGYDNVHVRCGDGTRGWPEHAPYDGIVVAAGGPAVPRSLREQLALGGCLVIPVGAEHVQTLLRIRRTGADSYDEEDLGGVRFVPLIGAEGWGEDGAPAAANPDPEAANATPAAANRPTHGASAVARAKTPTAAEAVALAAEPFEDIDRADLGPLLARIGDARVILLGEASHGTAEFYQMRARLTRALIEQAGVRIVAVEADWPDARQVDRYVRGARPDAHPEQAFTRFPTWMWANRQVLDFARWLRDWNAAQAGAREQAGFHGLDLYSMYTSIRAVLAYLDDVDAQAATVARTRYGCLTAWEHDPAAYGAAALNAGFDACASAVVNMLRDLLAQRVAYEPSDGERFFDAARNAALVKNAERFYRAMYYGPHQSWNLRDRHMFETLEALLDHRGAASRAVVWAHNSHLGNAAATAMSARGETNVGELAREAFGDSCYAIGFGTHGGTVMAADDWGGKHRVMRVNPSHERSYERVCHDSGVARFMLPLRRNHEQVAYRDMLAHERLERAIGVIYRPDSERLSHYFHACLPRQFDEWIWFDETRALDPVPVRQDAAKVPETFPFGV
jgi:protein-L-isoaspartate(D-aspartate) O-methyltransferase